jgi:hypothetical protein
MQTFLPYTSFYKSAECLDYRRLGKQRIETKQIWQALMGLSKKGGWVNHPAVKMWRGYEDALIWYGEIMCEEWIKRGYNDTTLPWFQEIKARRIDERKKQFGVDVAIPMPAWLGIDKFHTGHKQTLMFKQPDHYKSFEWKVEPKYEYWWPTENGF